MFVKTTAVFRMCGDYVAFHEVNITCEWVFGDTFFIEDDTIWDHLMSKLKLDYEDEYALEKQDKEKLDNLVKKYVEKLEREDYCDIAIQDALVELDEKGMPISAYM